MNSRMDAPNSVASPARNTDGMGQFVRQSLSLDEAQDENQRFVFTIANHCATLFTLGGWFVNLPCSPLETIPRGDNMKTGALLAAIELREMLCKFPQGRQALRDLGFECEASIAACPRAIVVNRIGASGPEYVCGCATEPQKDTAEAAARANRNATAWASQRTKAAQLAIEQISANLVGSEQPNETRNP